DLPGRPRAVSARSVFRRGAQAREGARARPSRSQLRAGDPADPGHRGLARGRPGGRRARVHGAGRPPGRSRRHRDRSSRLARSATLRHVDQTAVLSHRARPTLGLAVIGIITNPNALGLVRDKRLARRLADIVGNDGIVYETRTPEELRDAVRELHERRVDVLATCGGDGTNLSTLTEVVRTWRGLPSSKVLAQPESGRDEPAA